MHYNSQADRYVMDVNPCQPLRIAISRELQQLIRELLPGRKYRVELCVDEPMRNVAMDDLRTQLDYYGARMAVYPGTREIEIEVVA